jgi:hypothetical protein
LINNTAFVHLSLRYENPYCDRPIALIPKEFALRWQIPESSVYEAVGKLKSCNAIAIKSGKLTIEWVDSQQDDDSDNPEKILESQKKLRNPRKNSESSDQKNEARNPLSARVLTLFRLFRLIKLIQTLSQKAKEKVFWSLVRKRLLKCPSHQL